MKNKPPHEDELWLEVQKTVKPLKKSKPVLAPDVLLPPKKQIQKNQEQVPFTLPQKPTSAPLQIRPEAHKPTLRKTKKIRSEDFLKLDLHGLTQDQAYSRLETFLFNAISNKIKVVMVITGKGKGEEGGILRQKLPLWLENMSLAKHIISYTHAAQHHGGLGAYYIYLRTRIKKIGTL